MTRRIFLSLLMIGLTVAGVSGATAAYFSDTAVKSGNTFSMGTVEVVSAGGLPYTLSNLVPGEERASGTMSVRNTGSIAIDLYVGERDKTPTDGLEADFKDVVDYAINEVDCSTGNYVKQWIGWQSISGLFSDWNKVGENIPANAQKCYKVYVKPHADMQDPFQGKRAIADVILYAVQAGSPRPTGQPQVWQ
jgi:predicted ribosomally synthesized peptide with SipW-like signal peptide